jgi:arylsulfatase A-like enzyme
MRLPFPLCRSAITRVVLALLAGCEPSSQVGAPISDRPDLPNVVLVVIDNLRADHLGAYGYSRNTSPHLDGWAEKGRLFTDVRATSSWTKPSMGSLFTSRIPSEHGAVGFTRHLSDSTPTLAETFRAAGYRTVGVTGNFVHVRDDTGLARGFEHFRAASVSVERDEDAIFSSEQPSGGAAHLRAPTADELNRVVARLLPKAGDAPLFLYVHYMEPHAGFAPSPASLAQVLGDTTPRDAVSAEEVAALARADAPIDARVRERLVALYDGEIAEADAGMARLLERLERRGDLDGAIVAVVSDHGEEFGEHGGWFHGLNLHDESLRIPLLIVAPDVPAGSRSAAPASLIDVAPTLLAAAGVPVPESMRGRDLRSDAPTASRPLVSELHCDPPLEAHLRRRVQWGSVTDGSYKAIVREDGEVSLFDLRTDPDEQAALDAAATNLPAALRAEIARRVDEIAARDTSACRAPVDLDDPTRAGLKALGYVE